MNIIIATITQILEDDEKLKLVMKEELKKIKEEYGTKRKTEIKEEISELKIDETLMLPKEDVVVVVTNDGYIKRVSNRSYQASKQEDTGLKDSDFVTGLYELNTLDVLLLFTDIGNYLYLPVHEIPDMKWKEIGKHISNIITIKAEEKIVSSMPVNNFDLDINVVTFTKLGMIKITKLNEYKVQRYSKPIMNIKLKAKDKVTNVSYNNGFNILVTTNTGYSLIFDINEVTVTGLKTSVVKSIKLKNIYVTIGIIFDNYN